MTTDEKQITHDQHRAILDSGDVPITLGFRQWSLVEAALTEVEDHPKRWSPEERRRIGDIGRVIGAALDDETAWTGPITVTFRQWSLMREALIDAEDYPRRWHQDERVALDAIRGTIDLAMEGSAVWQAWKKAHLADEAEASTR